VQVKYLRSILPENAKVGAGDKLTRTGSAHFADLIDIQRRGSAAQNLSFFAARASLNAAVSRAQYLAVVAAKLLEIPCGTVEQMKLANTFWWLDSYSKK